MEMRADDAFETTFWMDFSIADRFGEQAIRDTFDRAFKEWSGDYRYLTDLVITLNHKIWQHWQNGNEKTANLYNDMWMSASEYAETRLKEDELKYYFEMTD